MAKVYGYSDDIVCIEHHEGGCTEIDCYNKDVRIGFEDGTVIRVGYPKDGPAVWWIEVEEEGCVLTALSKAAKTRTLSFIAMFSQSTQRRSPIPSSGRSTPAEVDTLVRMIRQIAGWAGYEIINRIEFRCKKSGRCYR